MSVGASASSGTDQVLRLLASRSGLVFRGLRREEVELCIGRAMRQLGLDSPRVYAERLERGEVALDPLIEQITVGETYFFRDAGQLDFIRDRILPELRKTRGPEHTLRVWSAGCASGEEPYSLAILLEEEGLIERSRLLATDISNAALTRAREARYRSWSFRGCDSAFRDRYFHQSGPEYVLDQRLRRRVSFEALNLALDHYPSTLNGTFGMDLILLRNVLIYFDPEIVREVAGRMFESLSEGGWLIVGASDPLLAGQAPFETVVTEMGIFYQRRRGAESSVNPVPDRWLLAGAQRPVHPIPDDENAPLTGHRPPTTAPKEQRTVEETPLERARRALECGEYPLVIELTRGLIEDADAAALHLRALANMATPKEAEEAAAATAKRHPLSAEIHFIQASLLISGGRDQEAAVVLRRVLYLDNSLAIAHFLLGVILQRGGSMVEARRAYSSARRQSLGRPAEQAVPFGEGETYSRLITAIDRHLHLIGTSNGEAAS